MIRRIPAISALAALVLATAAQALPPIIIAPPAGGGLSTPVSTANGGLGAALTPVVGDLLAADATTSFGRIAAPAVGQVLKSNGVGVAPSWSGTPSLSSLALGAGTVSAPALTLNDADTGIYSPAAGQLAFAMNGTSRLDFGVTTANTWTVPGANLTVGSTITGANVASGAYIYWTAKSSMSSPSDGLILMETQAGGAFTRLILGANSATGVSLVKNTTTIQAKLGDSSAFTAIQGKLTTDTAYTAGDPTTTGYLVVYDSTGTAYRVPALLN